LWVNSQDLTSDYRKDIIGKIHTFWGKSMYKNSVVCAEGIQKFVKNCTLDKYTTLAFRLLLRYLEKLRAFRKKGRVYHECLERHPLPMFTTRKKLQEKEAYYRLVAENYSQDNRQNTQMFQDIWRNRHYDYAVRRTKTQYKYAQE
jgi:hypothetical protein